MIVSGAELREYAYYRTGGRCDRLYAPETIEELQDSVQEIRRSGLPWFLLGGGTNSIVMDEHWPGAVLVFRHMQRLEVRGDVLYVEAGVDNTTIARRAHEHGLAGAAWMNRLPGQLGGTVRMNARCYGGEISEIARRIVAVTRTGQVREYADRAVFRGYKDTMFMDNGDLVAAAELQLAPGDRAEILAKMKFCEDDRTRKGQFLFPNCGCVYKNDYTVGVPSGMLLETAGAKTLRKGAAEVSQGHANFVYNKGATSRDILELTIMMRELVYERFGVWLEYEMEMLGHVPEDLQERIAEVRPASFKPEVEKLRAKFRERSA